MANGKAGETNERAGRSAMRSTEAGSAMGDVARAGLESAERSMRGSEAVMRQGLQSRTQQTGRVSRGIFDAVGVYGALLQSTSGSMQALVAPSQALADGLPDVQRAAMEWLGQAVEANTRWAQDLLRCDSLSDIAQVYSRFMQDSIEGLLQGSAGVFHSTDRLIRNATEGIGEHAHRGNKVAEVMTTDVRIARPDDTVQHAAQLMSEEDMGALPVGEGDELVGMVTDRDIAVRLGAEGKDPKETKVRDVMTPEVKYVFEDEDVEHAAQVMAEQQVRRLPVMNRDKRLVGIVSLGDIATEQPPQVAGHALSGVSQEGGVSSVAAAAGDKPKRRTRSSR